MDIGRRVREIREDRGMPRTELARRAGVHRNTLLRLEDGTHMPSVDKVERLANALRVPPSALFEEPVLPKDRASVGGPGRIVLDDPVTHSDPDESVVLDMGPGKEPVRATVQQLAAGWSLMMREDMSAEEAWRVVTNQSGMASS
jgi:transcriptional regulator with XRE-family HTH domain